MSRPAAAAITCLFLLWGAAALAESAKQVEWVGDVPLMPGLTVEGGLGFAFESPEGRIVAIYLAGSVDGETLTRYYTDALDPLGWKPLSGRVWRREGETLAFRQVTAAGTTLWKVTIQPE